MFFAWLCTARGGKLRPRCHILSARTAVISEKVFTLQAVRMMFGHDRITKDESQERFSPSGGMHKRTASGQANVVSNIQKSTTLLLK